ncbi:hypothetical protein [Brevundimonas pondensis]|uniref:Uncharacterized protein n=1 Tax=Brevundimonas pondensis TaxID=2774189 RepID=A0ABX7SL61_9CAUL|nr:hypothetical protein [Brevundimonas pondensis]QTC88414.1 hypothetical protein IFE19_03205 [Brevundimonas pondensis]
MTTGSLYARMRTHGTLSEPKEDIPDAVFALPSTVHWMRAMAILVTSLDVGFGTGRGFYQRVQRKTLPEPQLNSIYEQLLFALNQLATLDVLATAANKADVARNGIVAWYYGVYGAASAMIAAADGSFPETHAATARQWDRQFVVPGLVMPPFADRIDRLGKADVEEALRGPRARGKHSLTTRPETVNDAWGCMAEYLSGSASWEQWNLQQSVKDAPAFRALGVSDFKTKAARALRDEAFNRRGLCFLHEAFRYRGKANYRDAIYLAYGKSVPRTLDGFIADLRVVLAAFSGMAAAYCAARVGREEWDWFVGDLAERGAISISAADVWSR